MYTPAVMASIYLRGQCKESDAVMLYTSFLGSCSTRDSDEHAV